MGGTKILGAVFNEAREPVYRIKKKSAENGEGLENVEQVIISVVEELLASSGIPMEQIAGAQEEALLLPLSEGVDA